MAVLSPYAPVLAPAFAVPQPRRLALRYPCPVAEGETLLVSDLHLGLPASRPCDLLEFLHGRNFGRLVLLGDIFHDRTLRHLDSDAWRLLRHLREIGQRPDRELVWLHGNHDRKLSKVVAGLLGVEGRETFSWQQHGRRCIALHGDIFDEFVSRNVRFGQMCSDLFAFCQRLMDPYHGWLHKLDAWQVKMAKLGDRVAEKAAQHAARLAFDIVVCGHTHEPLLRRFELPSRPVTYANTGAWVGTPASFVTVGPGGLDLDHLP